MNMKLDGTAVLKAIVDKMPAQHILLFGCILVVTVFAIYCVTLDHTYKMAMLKAA